MGTRRCSRPYDARRRAWPPSWRGAAAGTILVDADPYGGAVAQQLGILDEVSGLLAAARVAAGGHARRSGSGRCSGRSATHLSVVTGLPRADRWVEVRSESSSTCSRSARDHGHVVVDTGFCLEHDPASDFGRGPGATR